MLEWREREHDIIENEAMENPTTLCGLKDCGLYKF